MATLLLVGSGPARSNADTPTVRVLYLVSADRPVRSDYVDAVSRAARGVRSWYGEELGETFRLTVPVVEILQSPEEADWFTTSSPFPGARPADYGFYNAQREVSRILETDSSDPDALYVVYSDGPGNSGRAIPGFAYLPLNDLKGLTGELTASGGTERWVGGLGHELGHAFGLPHPDNTDRDDPDGDYYALMWAGFYGLGSERPGDPEPYLTEPDTTILKNSRYFSANNVSEPASALPLTGCAVAASCTRRLGAVVRESVSVGCREG